MSEPAPDTSALYASYCEDGRFFNPWGDREIAPTDILRLAFARNPYDRSRAVEIPRVANDGASLSQPQHSSELTWVGHSTFAIHDAEDVVLTDPHFGARAFFPKRTHSPGVPIESIPADAMAVVSHDHYDHLDRYTVEALPPSVQWFVPRGLADWFRRRGRENVVELGWWESAKRGRWTLTCLPAQHWSRRIEHPTNSTLWCSWLLDSGDYRYYFAGDTGYFGGFEEYGRCFEPIDVAMLPIGAYAPRWFMGYQHLDPQQAYQAFVDLDARYMLPMHWGTFRLTQEPLDQPPIELREAVSAARGDLDRVRILAIGERWHVPPRPARPVMGVLDEVRSAL